MKTWTTDSLRILDPQGNHVLTVAPVPAADFIASHVASLMTHAEAQQVTTMTLGNGEDTITCVITGELAGEMAERIGALLEHAVGMDTETITNLGYTLLESMQTVERLDEVNTRLMERAGALAIALERMVQIHTQNLTTTQIVDAVQHARKALGR